MAQEGVYNESWRRLAAAVVLQAAIDYVSPRPVATRNEKLLYKQSAREFFARAAEGKRERLWFDVLGVSPAALVGVLEAGPPEPLLDPRLLQRQACGERVNNGGRRERKI